MTTTNIRLNDAIALVALERHEAARLSSIVRDKRAAFESEIAGVVEQSKNAATAVSSAEATLKALALEIYDAGERATKHIMPGIEIKDFTVLDYDAGEAFDWALDHKIYLTLNKTEFEKLAKASPSIVPFVMVRTESRVQLSTNLGEDS